ncbi:GNAT family N-acetyltransferase [Thalassobacillus hwangdonensis]|uniref:GNAT family N-acetyltransferase n=1 Tax=Thalassobacillus hwangdonensis TaxID=546108 RepID=A0ABW3L1F1_9BACI
MKIESIEAQDITSVAELYCRVFSSDVETAEQNISKHAGYLGFKGVLATDENGSTLGFAYGYTSLPGQFYREKLVNQLTQAQIEEWLEDCFEFVELAVNPDHLRKGIASKLKEHLFKGLSKQTSVLTTATDNDAALQMYKRNGWEVLHPSAPVLSEANPQVIMAKKL